MSPLPQKDEHGKFIKGTGGFTPEEASAAGKLGAEKQRRNKSEAIRERADALLVDCGIEGGWEGADEGQRLLAEKAVKEDSAGSTASLRLLFQQTGQLIKAEKTETPGQTWNPESGDPCPTCGGNRVTIMLDDESLLDLAEILNGKAPVADGAAGVVDG